MNIKYPDDPSKPSKVSDAFMKRMDQRNDLILDRTLAKMWESIQTLHMGHVISELEAMYKILDKIDESIKAVGHSETLVPVEKIEARSHEALVFAQKMFESCKPDVNDSPELQKGKKDFSIRVFEMQMRAIYLLETFKELNMPKGPQRLPLIFNKLEVAGLIRPDQRLPITQAIYPTDSKVVPFAPGKK